MGHIFDFGDPFRAARDYDVAAGRLALGHPLAERLIRTDPATLPHPPRHISTMTPTDREAWMPALRIPWIEEALALPPEALGRLIWTLMLVRHKTNVPGTPGSGLFPYGVARVTDWLVEFDRRERRSRLSERDLRRILTDDAERLVNADFIQQFAILWLNVVLARTDPSVFSGRTQRAFRACLDRDEAVDAGKALALAGLCRLAGVPEEESAVFRRTRAMVQEGVAAEARVLATLHPLHAEVLATRDRRKANGPVVPPERIEALPPEERAALLMDWLRAADALRLPFWSSHRDLMQGYSRLAHLVAAHRNHRHPAPEWLVALWRKRYDPLDREGASFEEAGIAEEQVSTLAILLDMELAFRDDWLDEMAAIHGGGILWQRPAARTLAEVWTAVAHRLDDDRIGGLIERGHRDFAGLMLAGRRHPAMRVGDLG